ncbi:MAG: hypothetical protein FWE88_06870 [Phycisphaerae bacterium]|nr:hypothetical protein [Phycisphaerae bacterium]
MDPFEKFPTLKNPPKPDYEGLLANLRRQGTPKRMYHMELFHDGEIVDAICERYDICRDVDRANVESMWARDIAIRRFLGFDYLSVGLVGAEWQLNHLLTDDTAEGAMARAGGRSYMEEHAGPITSWEEFEKYPFPDPSRPECLHALEWFSKNLPDDMCIVAHTGHFCELLCWLMGYETLCFALYEQHDLVEALAAKILEFHQAEIKQLLQFPRVRALWGSDDMGYRNGLMISPADMREWVLRGHATLAKAAHEAGRLYFLHSCGKLSDITEDLIHDVKIDAKHSFEDTIEDCRDAKRTWGQHMAMIGGIDVDFLCRASEEAIRARVRDTLDQCMPGGGYALGSGNTVANYIPVDHYLAMVDEGRKWRG